MSKEIALRDVAHSLEKAEKTLGKMRDLATQYILKTFGDILSQIKNLYEREPLETAFGFLAGFGEKFSAFSIPKGAEGSTRAAAYELAAGLWDETERHPQALKFLQPVAEAMRQAVLQGAHEGELVEAFLANSKSWLLRILLGEDAWTKVMSEAELARLR